MFLNCDNKLVQMTQLCAVVKIALALCEYTMRSQMHHTIVCCVLRVPELVLHVLLVPRVLSEVYTVFGWDGIAGWCRSVLTV